LQADPVTFAAGLGDLGSCEHQLRRGSLSIGPGCVKRCIDRAMCREAEALDVAEQTVLTIDDDVRAAEREQWDATTWRSRRA